jgi:hypothetical protein
MSHVPHISSDYFFSRPDQLIKDLHRRDEIVAIPDWVMENVETDQFSNAKAWHWIRQHATCTIGIFNEYGESLAQWEAKQKEAEDYRSKRVAAKLCWMRVMNKDGSFRGCPLPLDHESRPHEWSDPVTSDGQPV